jgi:hypothetical protein
MNERTKLLVQTAATFAPNQSLRVDPQELARACAHAVRLIQLAEALAAGDFELFGRLAATDLHRVS